MIVLNERNFSIHTLHKEYNAAAAPKDTYYADFRICLVLRGEAVWEIGERVSEVSEGDIVFLQIGQRRRFVSFGKAGLLLCVFTFSRDAFADLRHFLFFRECIKKQGGVMKKSALFGLLLEIWEERESRLPDRYDLASAKMSEFFIKAEREAGYRGESETVNGFDISGIMDYIDENLFGGPVLSLAAKEFGMSESALSRRFYAVNRVSFKQYVVEKKMQRALHLLKNTDLKMLDVALECGYDSVSGFYAAFHKHFGTTPNKLSFADA